MSRNGRPAIMVLGLAKDSSAYLVVLIGAEYTQVAISRSTESGCASAFGAIPPTAVGGSFKPSLQRRAHSNFPEFHPRQWVEGSSAAYNQRDHRLLAIVLYGQRLNLKHPPTALGGIPGAATPLSCRPGLNNPLPWVGLQMTRTR